MDEAHRRGRQYGMAEFAPEREVLPRGEAVPEPQAVAHPDRGAGDGHRRGCDLPPATVPVATRPIGAAVAPIGLRFRSVPGPARR
ncbi:hypothetical protein AB0Q97_44625, partial [Streptomyces sp. NPDC088135]